MGVNRKFDFRRDWMFCWDLKLVSSISYQIFIFHQMMVEKKTKKNVFYFILKDLFVSRYSNFCIFVFPSFFPVSYCFRGWLKKNLKVYHAINCLNKNLITHFVWYLEKDIKCDTEILPINRVLNVYRKYIFTEKPCRKCALKAYPRCLFHFAK